MSQDRSAWMDLVWVGGLDEVNGHYGQREIPIMIFSKRARIHRQTLVTQGLVELMPVGIEHR